MNLLITNIHQLINVRTESKLLRGKELAEMPVIKNAFLLVEEVDICIAKKNPPIQNFVGNVAVSYQLKRSK